MNNYFKILIKLILIAILLSAHQSFGNNLDTQIQQIIRKNKEFIDIQSMRNNPTYLRVIRLCLHPDQISNYPYFTTSAKQIISATSGNRSEMEQIFFSGATVSPLLNYDLQQDSFYLALDDCGYSDLGKNLFVVSLISQDIAGKFAGAITIYGLFKIAIKIYRSLHSRSKIAARVLATTGLTSAIYHWYEQNIKLETNSNASTHKSKKIVQQFYEHHQFEQIEVKNSHLQFHILQIIDTEIEQLEKELQQVSAKEAFSLQEKLNKKKIKRQLLLSQIQKEQK